MMVVRLFWFETSWRINFMALSSCQFHCHEKVLKIPPTIYYFWTLISVCQNVRIFKFYEVQINIKIVFYGFTSAKMLSIGCNCKKIHPTVNTIDKIEKIPTLICQYWFRRRQVSQESFFSCRFLLFCSYFFYFFIFYILSEVV